MAADLVVALEDVDCARNKLVLRRRGGFRSGRGSPPSLSCSSAGDPGENGWIGPTLGPRLELAVA
eukprot:15435258-Alexandrium_andersonii.AAC.1